MGFYLSSIQFEVLLGKIDGNLKKVEKFSEYLPKGGLLLLPEMFCCGFDYDRMGELAKEADTVLGFLKELSLKLEGVVVGTLPTEEEGNLFNTAVVFDKGKFLGKRSKIELFPVYKETEFFSPAPAEENRVFNTSVGKVGISICFEIRFPYITSELRKKGAEIILVPAMWGIERREHFKVLTRARAIETQSFLVASNGWGRGGSKTFFGGSSAIYSPWGEILAYKEDGEGPSLAEVELSQVEKVRKKIPVRF